jgi:sugar/nucleoside kinase (ribokinase family)
MDVLSIGHAAWDISLVLDGFPVENSKLEIHEMHECGGGPAANAAYLLSRWGVSSGIATTLGTDAYGDRIAEEFAAAKTDVSWIERKSSAVTPVSVILVNQLNGSRTIINRKAAAAESLKLGNGTASGSAPRVLLFDGHEPEASLDAMRRFPEALTILDAGSLRDGARELAKHVDYLVASERFACQMAGLPNLDSQESRRVAISTLFRWNGKPVVVTLGEGGMLRGMDASIEHYPTFPVRAIDTTAAGDIYHGAFAYGVLMQFPIEKTMRLAAAAAAISVTRLGGRTSIPTLAETLEKLHHAE